MRIVLAILCIVIAIATTMALLLSRTRDPNKERPDISTAGASGHQYLLPKEAPRFQRWVSIGDFDESLAIYHSVFWEPLDTVSLRRKIREDNTVKGKSVLEIGTGSGLIALCCLKAGASSVVATDINPNAISNAKFNADRLGLSNNLDLRQVPINDSGAYSIIADNERFDLIISNPPWEDQVPQSIAEFALYDRQFNLLKSILKGLRDHLRPGGKVLLAYGCVDAIKKIAQLAPKHNLKLEILDTRDLKRLPDVFLPGMLLELTLM